MNTGLFWVIPISSQVSKYTAIYNNKLQRHGKCDTIVFGDVVGHRKAFLIQNMCPVTPKYIKDEYSKSLLNAVKDMEIDIEFYKEKLKKSS